jgi:hypothetical protein
MNQDGPSYHWITDSYIQQALAPHLIAFRVSQGCAWTRIMTHKPSIDFKFAKPSANSGHTEATAFDSRNDIIVLFSRGGGSTTKLGKTTSSPKTKPFGDVA